jgi:hypothetical protein
MCGIGETGDICGLRGRGSVHELIRSPLKSKPKNIGTYRNSRRLREHVHESVWRKAGDLRQSFERKVLALGEVFAEIFENPADSRVNLHCSTAIQQISTDPTFYARLRQLGTERHAPMLHLCCGNAPNFTLDSLNESGAEFALRIDKSYK